MNEAIVNFGEGYNATNKNVKTPKSEQKIPESAHIRCGHCFHLICVCVVSFTLTVWSWLPVTTLPAAALSTVMGFWWAHCTERVS